MSHGKIFILGKVERKSLAGFSQIQSEKEFIPFAFAKDANLGFLTCGMEEKVAGSQGTPV